jgi:hypothetical protein
MDITGIDLSPRLESLPFNVDDTTINELLAQAKCVPKYSNKFNSVKFEFNIF